MKTKIRYCGVIAMILQGVSGISHAADQDLRATGKQVFDRWCHLGSAQDEAGALALATAPRAFDADVWRILARWLAVPAHLAQVRELAAQADEEAPGAA